MDLATGRQTHLRRREISNHMNPLISIITPTFNHEAYVRQCVDSVLAQTYPDWEQIIIDDGSTDGTPEVIRQIGEGRIHLVVQPHRGIFRLAETYNCGLQHAHGDLIAILEGDDFWPPEKLATLVPAFADPGVVLAFGQTVMTTPEGQPSGITIPESSLIGEFGEAALFNTPIGAITKVMFRRPMYMFPFPCSVIVRRGALEGIGGFQHIEGIPFVDYQTFLTLSLAGRYFYTSKVMGFWRRHRQSATALRYQDLTDLRLLAYMRRFFETHRSAMALTQEEETDITDTLQDWERRMALYHGRAALNKGRWAEARRHFRTVLGARRPIARIKGAVGVAASYLHFDLEWLVAIRAQLFDREARLTGVRRRSGVDVGPHSDRPEEP